MGWGRRSGEGVGASRQSAGVEAGGSPRTVGLGYDRPMGPWALCGSLGWKLDEESEGRAQRFPPFLDVTSLTTTLNLVATRRSR